MVLTYVYYKQVSQLQRDNNLVVLLLIILSNLNNRINDTILTKLLILEDIVFLRFNIYVIERKNKL